MTPEHANNLQLWAERGWVTTPKGVPPTPEHLKQLAKQRICMARLRAEQRGQPTDKFPRRERAVGLPPLDRIPPDIATKHDHAHPNRPPKCDCPPTVEERNVPA